MGYFDRLTSSYFRTGKDGRRLFYPRGAMGRGYVVPSEDEYQRLHRIAKIFTAAFHVLTYASLVLIIAAAALQMYCRRGRRRHGRRHGGWRTML